MSHAAISYYVTNEVSGMYDFSCEHCDGTVRKRQVSREALRYKGTFVILEQVPVGGQAGA